MHLGWTSVLLLAAVEARRNRNRKRNDSATSDDDRTSFRQSLTGKRRFDKWTSLEDITRMASESCIGVTAGDLNKIPSEACAGLTNRCLNQINVTGINVMCQMNWSIEVIKNMTRATFAQLIQNDAEHMFFSVEDLEILMSKYGGEHDKFPSTFMAYITSDTNFADAFIRSLIDLKHYTAIAQIFAHPYVERLDPLVFRVISKDALPRIPAGTFRLLSKEQLAAIPHKSLARLTPAQFQAIPPASFEVFSMETLILIDGDCLQTLTQHQARNLGPDPSNIPQVTATEKAERETQIIQRRFFIERHACNAVEERSQLITSQTVRDAIKQRCDGLRDSAIMLGKGISGTTSDGCRLGISGMVLASALLVSLLVQ